jgi:hypothetical protein
MSARVGRLAFVLSVALAFPGVAERQQPAKEQPNTQELPVHFVVNAGLYEAVKTVLMPGDAVWMSVARGPSPESAAKLKELTRGRKPGELTADERAQLQETTRQHPWTLDEQKLQRAIDLLVAVKDERLQRNLVFSSFADLEKHIDRLPKQINCVSFNTESGMTPTEENQDIATFIQKFCELAHKKGFRAGWGPSLDYFDRMGQRDTLGKALVQVDQVGLQLQRILQQGDIAKLKQFTEDKVKLIHKYNPQAKIVAQLVLGRQDVQQSIEGFKAISGQADYLAVFTLTDAEGTKQIVEGVRAK